LKKLLSFFTMVILLNPNSATVCYSCYAGCINNSFGGTALGTASPTPQVVGNTPGCLYIVLWLVVSPIEPLNFLELLVLFWYWRNVLLVL
jgi:hypothetical protein